jgi:hypothetical protein
MDALYRDNGKWAFVYVAIASGAATFVLAGRLGWEIGAAVIVVLVITALSLTTLREMQARKVAEAKRWHFDVLQLESKIAIRSPE